MTSMLVALVISTLLGTQQSQPRDSAAATVAGTARLSGIVVTDERPPRPMRRAIVTISGSTLPLSRSTITDDGGRFEFHELPAGRFTVTAARKAYVTTGVGARRAGRPGTAVSVAAGANVEGLRITLPKGAVLTGVVSDINGAPIPSLPVSVFRLTPSYASAGSDITDDRGVYRVYGLSPGDYVVAAVPRTTGVGDMAVMSEKEIDTALRALERRTSPTTAERPGAAVANEVDDGSVRRAYSFAPSYHPGTAVASDATKITVAAGEERSGLDFTLGMVPTASVGGVVTGIDGQPARDVQLSILSIGPSLPLVFGMTELTPSHTGADGTFLFASVTPGTYRITARRMPGAASMPPGAVAPPSTAQGRGPTTEWAVAEVTVNGDDVAGLSLSMRPGLKLTGRVVFEGTATLPSNLSSLRVTLTPVPVPARGGGVVPVGLRPDGSFEITNLLPNAYAIALTLPENLADGWWPRSAIARGRDLLDVPLDLTAGGDAPEVVFTLSDRRPLLTGQVQNADGQPSPDCLVVAFSAEQAHWLPKSRRVRVVRPATDGHYRVEDVPPGEYYVSTIEDADEDQWYESAFLRRLAGTAVRVVIGEGEQKVQDLRMRAGG
jgi:uncharacterized protein (DUF2141 family)